MSPVTDHTGLGTGTLDLLGSGHFGDDDDDNTDTGPVNAGQGSMFLSPSLFMTTGGDTVTNDALKAVRDTANGVAAAGEAADAAANIGQEDGKPKANSKAHSSHAANKLTPPDQSNGNDVDVDLDLDVDVDVSSNNDDNNKHNDHDDDAAAAALSAGSLASSGAVAEIRQKLGLSTGASKAEEHQ